MALGAGKADRKGRPRLRHDLFLYPALLSQLGELIVTAGDSEHPFASWVADESIRDSASHLGAPPPMLGIIAGS
jgi:hypothetical protein